MFSGQVWVDFNYKEFPHHKWKAYAQAISIKQQLQIPEGLTRVADILRGSYLFSSLVTGDVFSLCRSVERSVTQLDTSAWVLLKYVHAALPRASREADRGEAPSSFSQPQLPISPSLPLTDTQWTQPGKRAIWKTVISLFKPGQFSLRSVFWSLTAWPEKHLCRHRGREHDRPSGEHGGQETRFGGRTGFCQLN